MSRSLWLYINNSPAYKLYTTFQCVHTKYIRHLDIYISISQIFCKNHKVIFRCLLWQWSRCIKNVVSFMQFSTDPVCRTISLSLILRAVTCILMYHVYIHVDICFNKSLHMLNVSFFVVFTMCLWKETFPTCATNMRSPVAVHVHVSHIISFAHKTFVASIALETVLSWVSLHVILASSHCLKSFVTEAAVRPRHGGMRRFKLLEVQSCFDSLKLKIK